MEIKFDNSSIKKLCSSYEKALKKLGKKNADKLFRRIATLEVAETLADVTNMSGNFHQLSGDRAGTWACSLDGALRLIFKPEGDLPTNQVICVIIIETVDYHNKRTR